MWRQESPFGAVTVVVSERGLREITLPQKRDGVWLRFGENSLVLRSAAADGKPYCNEFGLVVENYEQAKVKAELDRRGIASRPNPAGGLLLKDPNGLDIGVAGKV